MGTIINRIVWKFTGTKNANGQYDSSSSPMFSLHSGFGQIYVEFKTLLSGKTACSFRCVNSFCNPELVVVDRAFYMLNEATGQHKKLVYPPKDINDWFDLGALGDRLEFLLVFAMDFDDYYTYERYESWEEVETEVLNQQILFDSSSFLIKEKQCRLKFFSKTKLNKSILMDGLEKDETINAKFRICNIKSGGSVRYLPVILRSKSEEYSICKDERVDKVELLSITTDLKSMDKARVSEIAKIIDNIDLHLIDENAKPFQDVCELKTTKTIQNVQLPVIKPIDAPASSTSSHNDDSSALTPATASAVTALEQLKFMFKCYTENKFCDITIKVADGQEIRAHKNVLSSGSTVWRQLLTNDEQLSSINVADLERDTIEPIVTYIYIGSVPKPPKQTDQLLIAAEKYGIDGLKTLCEQELMTSITIDSAINLLILAHQYNAKTLFNEVWKFVKENIAVLKQRSEWNLVFSSYPELAFELFISLL